MDENEAHITCPECGHTFTIRDDVLAKLNYVGMRIDTAADIIVKAVEQMSSNPMLAALIGKR